MTRPAADNVKVIWTGTGTGTMSLGAAVTGFQAFPEALDGHKVSYAIDWVGGSPDTVERETGIGTYTASGTTLTRDLVTFSTAGAPTKVSFSDGTKHVRLVALAHEVAENRATSNPTVNDDVTAGYVAGRSRWLNTSTLQLFELISDAAGAARWDAVKASPRDAVAFNGTTIATDAFHNTRQRWQGTSGGTLSAPTGLTNGVDFEVVIDHDLASIAPLIVQRSSSDGARRLGGPIGCRVLRPGGIARVRYVEDGVYITGDLDPATMAEPATGGSPTEFGASFLLERGLRQTESGGVLQSWGDKYGINNFTTVTGDPGRDADTGAMTLAQALDADAYLSRASITFAGTSLLFGFSVRIDAAAGTNLRFIGMNDHAAGRGLWVPLNTPLTSGSVNFYTDASTQNGSLGYTHRPGYPMAGGLAIDRSAGYAHAFFDEGHVDKERHETVSGLTFVVDWTGASIANPQIGPSLSASQSITAEIYAVTIRDNLTFSDEGDARAQAHAMLAEMRSYYA